MLNDHPIVLNDRVLEHLLAGLHQLGGRLRSHRPTREPLSKHVGKSARSPLAFDAALCVAAMYRRLIAQHPRVLLRELDGAGTFEAADLSNRFQDELDWADLATIGAARRPVQRPGSSFDQRNFRIRQFVGFMRSEHGFTLTRSQTVGLVAEIARAFPGRYPLSENAIENALNRVGRGAVQRRGRARLPARHPPAQ